MFCVATNMGTAETEALGMDADLPDTEMPPLGCGLRGSQAAGIGIRGQKPRGLKLPDEDTAAVSPTTTGFRPNPLKSVSGTTMPGRVGR
jgi:hypothetical protein